MKLIDEKELAQLIVDSYKLDVLRVLELIIGKDGMMHLNLQ